MLVRYEGVTNVYHTPYLLPLVNLPRMINEFEIITNETFILPLQQGWTYIPGSPKATFYVIGDVCGPFFYLSDDELFTTEGYLRLSYAPIEAGIFSFGTIMHNLMYMRQGHGGRAFNFNQVVKYLETAQYEYQRILDCYDKDGFFTQYCAEETDSVWATAWAITVLKDGIDPSWERNGLYMDPELFNNTLSWLVMQQNEINGSWGEPYFVNDRKFNSNLTLDWNGELVQFNLSLTAHCLIALQTNSDIRG
jgi:hypothetical protein